MTSLQTLAGQVAETEAILFDRGGEVPEGSDLDMRVKDDFKALAVKTDNMAEYAISLESRADGLEEAAKKVLARAKAMRNHKQRLLDYVSHVMGDKQELVGECFSFKRRKTPPRVEFIDEDAVHDSCPEGIDLKPLDGRIQIKDGQAYIEVINKNALRDALKTGQHVHGAMLVQGTRLDIV